MVDFALSALVFDILGNLPVFPHLSSSRAFSLFANGEESRL